MKNKKITILIAIAITFVIIVCVKYIIFKPIGYQYSNSLKKYESEIDTIDKDNDINIAYKNILQKIYNEYVDIETLKVYEDSNIDEMNVKFKNLIENYKKNKDIPILISKNLWLNKSKIDDMPLLRGVYFSSYNVESENDDNQIASGNGMKLTTSQNAFKWVLNYNGELSIYDNGQLVPDRFSVIVNDSGLKMTYLLKESVFPDGIWSLKKGPREDTAALEQSMNDAIKYIVENSNE